MKNRNKAIIVASLVGAVNSYATCSVPSNGATAGSTVTCTGTTTGVYSINAANVTFLNQGDMTGTGIQFGIIISQPTTTTGINVTNQGTISWNNAQYGGTGTGTRAAVNAGYITTNNLTAASFVNELGAEITVDITTNLSSGRAISAVGVAARYGQVTLYNKGSITTTSTSTNGSGDAVGIAAAGGNTQIINSGSVIVNANQGSSAQGIGIYGAWTNGDASINNSGTVTVSALGTNTQAVGISALTTSATSAKIVNSGTIELKGGVTFSAGRSAISFTTSGTSSVSIPLVFINTSTGVVKADSASYAVSLSAANTNTSAVQITNSGIISSDNFYAIVTRAGNDTYTQDAGSLMGSTYLGAGNDTFAATGGKIVGSVYLADGSDTATISNVDLSTIPTLDGGDDTLIADGFIDTLTLSNTSVATTELLNWEKIVLDATTFESPNNTLSTGTDVGYGLFLTNGSLLNAGTIFNLTGNLDIDSASIFQGYGAGSGVYGVSGSVTNAGTMTTQDGAAGDVITVGGDYTGVSGSTYKIDTVLGNDSSTTDNLVVEGNTSGTSTLIVRPAAGSPGAQTIEGIKVIDVAGTSGATFTLASAVQAGAYEYTLFKNGVTDPIDGDWYLRSTLIPVIPTDPATPIYRPGTSNYVSGQTANAEQGFAALGTLHERMNEQQVVSTDKQTWARYYGNTESNNGDSRFNYNQHISAAQVGQDLYNKTTTNGTNVHSGVMFDYSYSTVDFADRVREDALLDNTTGTMNGTSYGIGGYYTAINGDESYLDVVGMVSKLENKYKDSYGMKSTQDGYRLGLSVEAGKKLAELGKWKVEGQGQLAYQYTNYDNFNDDISGIDAYGANTLRGRLGVRVYRHLESTKNIQQIDNAQVYGVANVVQDFINPTDVTVGGTNVSEKFDKTTLEVGGGFQVPVTGTTYVYTDARYDRSIKGNKEQGKLTIGFKTQF